MNERIKELIEQCIEQCEDYGSWDNMVYTFDKQKFAALIIEECYQHCKDQLMDKKLAEEAGLDYNDGVMDCANGLLQHFGVEE